MLHQVRRFVAWRSLEILLEMHYQENSPHTWLKNNTPKSCLRHLQTVLRTQPAANNISTMLTSSMKTGNLCYDELLLFLQPQPRHDGPIIKAALVVRNFCFYLFFMEILTVSYAAVHISVSPEKYGLRAS